MSTTHSAQEIHPYPHKGSRPGRVPAHTDEDCVVVGDRPPYVTARSVECGVRGTPTVLVEGVVVPPRPGPAATAVETAPRQPASRRKLGSRGGRPPRFDPVDYRERHSTRHAARCAPHRPAGPTGCTW
ncbi:hypothetical protein [Streptomyces sp. NPDC047869]|uniref:hypothetical protein n=1 Tax=Streptomyces sp. NPDC047869 TaxID=3154709 RepID=UPI003455116B